jgi:phosphate transport system protein
MIHSQPDDHRLPWIADRSALTLRVARTALTRATAVLFGDRTTAEDSMKAAEQALRALRGEIEELLAAPPLGTPSSSAVRATVAMVHLTGDMERLADLTQQIAEIAWSRQSKRPMPAPVRSAAEAMSGDVLALLARAGETVALEPAAAAGATAALDRDLEEISGQQARLDRLLVSEAEDPQVNDSGAVDVALLGRCYESCARHAVAAARHVAILAT